MFKRALFESHKDSISQAREKMHVGARHVNNCTAARPDSADTPHFGTRATLYELTAVRCKDRLVIEKILFHLICLARSVLGVLLDIVYFHNPEWQSQVGDVERNPFLLLLA